MNPPADRSPLERRLAAWQPAPPASTSGRDRLLYQAGLAAGRREARWRSAALAAAVGLIMSAWSLRERAERRRLEPDLAARSPAAPAPPRPESALAAAPPDLVLPELSSLPMQGQHLRSTGSGRFDRSGSRPGPARASSRGQTGPVLTPFSSRRAAEIADL